MNEIKYGIIPINPNIISIPEPPPATFLLLENGENILLEDGFKILLES